MSSTPYKLSEGLHLIDEEVVFNEESDMFIRSLQLSPDGTQALLSTEDNFMKIYEIEPKIVDANRFYGATASSSDTTDRKPLEKKLDIPIGESIFDFKWYPFKTDNDEATCCFLTTSRDHPIHLWDSVTGHLRGSYAGYDHLDELNSANSLTFNLTGDKIYGGYTRMLRWFDVSYPGKNFTNIPLTKNRRDYTGQKGIVSCLVFNPDYSNTFAAGSYADSVGMYVENMDGCALEIRNLNLGGVTCLKWSPCGKYIYIGGRDSNDIVCWDVRSSQQEVGRVERSLHSNQRLQFDVDPWGKYLVTGSQLGEILVYDTTSFSLVTSISKDSESSNADSKEWKRMDCVSNTVFHPFSSVIISTSGQRHFADVSDEGHDTMNTDAVSSTSSTSGIQLWSVNYNAMELPASLDQTGDATEPME